jgi:hypothetical protein
MLLDAQRFCASCGFDFADLQEKARQAQADGDSAGTDARIPGTAVMAQPSRPVAPEAAPAHPTSPEALPQQPAQPTVPTVEGQVSRPEEAAPAAAGVTTRPAPAPLRKSNAAPSPSLARTEAAAVRPAARSRRRLFLVLGIIVLLLVVAGVGFLVLSKSGSSSSQPSGLASTSLDPEAPAFPVPAGSTILNASTEGSAASAYRLVAWQSAANYATTAAFYTGLKDARWQTSGSPVTTPQTTQITFTDGSGVFARGDVEVDRTDPVRIEVRFLSNASPSVQSFSPGPTMAFGPLPSASALPDGFPPALVPPGTTLVDAGALGSTDFALFSGSVDISAYETQIGSVVKVTGTASESGATVIDFTDDGNSGEITIDPTSGQVSVEVTK